MENLKSVMQYFNVWHRRITCSILP